MATVAVQTMMTERVMISRYSAEMSHVSEGRQMPPFLFVFSNLRLDQHASGGKLPSCNIHVSGCCNDCVVDFGVHP